MSNAAIKELIREEFENIREDLKKDLMEGLKVGVKEEHIKRKTLPMQEVIMSHLGEVEKEGEYRFIDSKILIANEVLEKEIGEIQRKKLDSLDTIHCELMVYVVEKMYLRGLKDGCKL